MADERLARLRAQDPGKVEREARASVSTPPTLRAISRHPVAAKTREPERPYVPPPAFYLTSEVEGILASSGVPPRLLLADRKRFPYPTPKYWRTKDKEPNNVCLLGPNSTGKSHGAVLIATEWIPQMRRGQKVLFVKARDIAKAVVDREEWETETAILLQFKRPELLILDDIDEVCGKDYSTPKLTWIREILDSRLDYLRATIITGNRSVQAWGEVDTAIQGRLCAFDVIEVEGENQWLI